MVNSSRIADPTELTNSEFVSTAAQIHDLLKKLPKIQINMDIDWLGFKNQDWIALIRQNQIVIERILQE